MVYYTENWAIDCKPSRR